MVIQQADLGLFGWELGKNGLVPPDTVRTVGSRVRTLVEAIFFNHLDSLLQEKGSSQRRLKPGAQQPLFCEGEKFHSTT